MNIPFVHLRPAQKQIEAELNAAWSAVRDRSHFVLGEKVAEFERLFAGYCGALGRLLLTPQSPVPSAGVDPALFGVIGSYFMLYGVPEAIPTWRRFGRTGQIASLALIWIVVQIAFAIAARSFELSTGVVAPIFGLVAGVALAKPLLAWRYRGA